MNSEGKQFRLIQNNIGDRKGKRAVEKETNDIVLKGNITRRTNCRMGLRS